MAASLQVALLFDTSFEMSRGAVAGIRHYDQNSQPWVFRNTAANIHSLSLLKSWPAHGAIGYFTPELWERITELEIPVVNVGGRVEFTQSHCASRVISDPEETGRMTFRYLRGLGFCNFAYFGTNLHPVSPLRRDALKRAVESDKTASLSWREIEIPFAAEAETWLGRDRTLRDWLASLPKPVAVSTFHDAFGQELLDTCRMAAWRVPEQVAVLGHDDDAVYARTSNLSSIQPNSFQMGWEAARELDLLLSGRKTKGLVSVPPKGIAVRSSTDVLAFPDEDFVRALQYLRTNAGKTIDVGDMVREMATSRRLLEQKFQRWLGRSPLQELQRARLEIARELLQEGELSVSDIARRSGFKSAKAFARFFRNQTGQAPSEYRVGIVASG